MLSSAAAGALPADKFLSLPELPDVNLSLQAQSGAELTFVIIGLVLLLGGWLVFRFGTRLLGIALGAAMGFFIGEVLNVILKVDRDLGLMITIGCSAIGGLAALIMIRAVTNLLFAIIGLLFGALLGRLGAEIYAAMHHTEFIFSKEAGLAIMAVAIVTAIAAIWLQRLIMILTTSYMGATFLVAGVDYLTARPMSFPVILTAGIIWQAFILGRIFVSRKPKAPHRRAIEQDQA
jgi:hypothetical protein